jgi:hypothetical protein
MLRDGLHRLNLERDQIKLTADNGELTRQKDYLGAGLEERKRAEETMVRLSRELADARASQVDSLARINVEENNELQALDSSSSSYGEQLELVRQIYDTKRLTENNRLLDQYKTKIDELNQRFYTLAQQGSKSFREMWGSDIKGGIDNLDAAAKSAVKWATEYNRINAQSDAESARHRVAMAAASGSPNDPLGTVAIQRAIQLDDIEARYEEKLRLAANDQDRSVILRSKELELQKVQNQEEEAAASLRHKRVSDFFRDTQSQSKTTGDVLYESMNSALDRVSDQFARLFTGQKTSFMQVFRSLGEDMARDSVKSGMQKGLGELGKVFGVHSPDGKPDGTQGRPFHVIVDNEKLSDPMAGISASLPPAFMPTGGLKGVLGKMGGLFGNLFHGPGGSSASSITYLAAGGDMDPGRIYGVAENGEAEIVTPKHSSRVTPISKLGGETHYHDYNIDARGAALGVENRIARAIEFAHNSAVRNASQASAERARRTPRRR